MNDESPYLDAVVIEQPGKIRTLLHHRHNIEGACSACEIEKLRKELKIATLKAGYVDRLPFCADHRDKVAGQPCRECAVEQLKRALEPFAHFARMWEANPIGGRRLPNDHAVYAIHTGAEWEAELTLGMLRRALASLEEIK